jgi:hypothetical protein
MATLDDEARHERKAKRPWPTKSELSKRKPDLLDTEGRKYYMVDILNGDEERKDYVLNFMSDFKNPQAYWISLPKKVTIGGMPEQSTTVTFKVGMKMKVLGVSEMTDHKQRGTGLIVFAGG